MKDVLNMVTKVTQERSASKWLDTLVGIPGPRAEETIQETEGQQQK